ncbi:endonuclease SmrB [Thalassotalea sp. ND16A]|uniref:endonuclease SmrB n=1 Tax=Thalassotalea sp. ND16A TaxID=1535422 RepID=UPI00051A3A5D|nr:endonuclease SmrB [Thalassotalea sp. ND16A]KGK00749.1 hypothetical protein ND16A_0233 [Thalassotalea sp. ND16A]
MKLKDLICDDDKTLFKQAIGPVKPIKHDTIHPRTRVSKKKTQQQKEKQQFEKQQFFFSDEFEPNLESKGPMKYVRDDVDSFEAKRLRRGEYSPELILDLHGLKQQESKQEIAALLAACPKQHVNCVCIIHGIGNRILKNKVPHWLVQHPDVMAFHQAPLEYGGNGALLVLIDLKGDDFCK